MLKTLRSRSETFFHHCAQRVVAGFEPGVFVPQLIGGVLELVFDGRVEEERKPDVVEDAAPNHTST